jgi:putative MATE family efflux protein
MKKLTEGNIWKNFILFAIPLMLSGLLSTAYTMIDTMIAGHYLGEAGLAATGATSSMTTFVSSLFWGYMVGFGMYIARLFGEGAYDRMYRGTWVHFGVCTAIALGVTVFSVIFCDPLLHFLNVDAQIWNDAKEYFLIYISGFCLFLFNANAVFLLGSMGDSSFPFYMSLISSVLNVGGNILSVTVLDMGVGGIAWSSVISAMVVSVFYLLRFRSIFRKLLPNGSSLKWNLTETRIALPYTVPPILQQGTIYVANLLLAPMINGIGSEAIASYMVTSQIFGLVGTMFQNSSRSVSNYTAQCLGSPYENTEMRRRLRMGIGVGLVQSVLFALLVMIPCLIFPEFTASIFFAEGSAQESIALTVFCQRVFLPFTLFNVVTNLFHGVFRATKAKGLLIFSTVFASAVRIAVSFPLTAQYGVNGFWAGLVISWVAEAFLLVLVYLKNWWMPKELRPQKV